MNAQKGWSLIELLTALAVVGVLAAIATVAYPHYLLRVNRSQAQQLMLTIMDRQQQYALDSREFASSLGSIGLNFGSSGWNCTVYCNNGYYTVSVTANNAATPATFIITANPAGSSQVKDGTLTLDSAGMRARVLAGANLGW